MLADRALLKLSQSLSGLIAWTATGAAKRWRDMPGGRIPLRTKAFSDGGPPGRRGPLKTRNPLGGTQQRGVAHAQHHNVLPGQPSILDNYTDKGALSMRADT